MARGGEDFVRNVFCPHVAVLCSDAAQEMCRKNNLSFCDLLNPFARLTDGKDVSPGFPAGTCAIDTISFFFGGGGVRGWVAETSARYFYDKSCVLFRNIYNDVNSLYYSCGGLASVCRKVPLAPSTTSTL